MPKGKGAASMLGTALETDLANIQERGFENSEEVEVIERISITIPNSTLQAADEEVFKRKRTDRGMSRSGLIDEALKKLLKLK